MKSSVCLARSNAGDRKIKIVDKMILQNLPNRLAGLFQVLGKFEKKIILNAFYMITFVA